MFSFDFSIPTRSISDAVRVVFVLLVTALAAPGLPAAFGAGIYKWVDDKGVTHYSESPPEGRASSTLKPPPPLSGGTVGAPVPKSWQEKEQEFQRRRAEREETESKKAAKDAEDRVARERRCRIARNRLHVLQQPRPVYRINAKGEREYYDDAARAAEIEKLRKEIAASCD